MRHHPDELENLLPAGDKARAQHVVHAEGLGGRGGRRGRVVRGIRELLAQLQVVQNEPVAVVGYAQAVRGLAIGGGGKVGADPGGQPCASVRALGQQRPVQRAQRGVKLVEVAAPVRRQKAVGQADLVDGEPGIALQVQGLSQVYLKVAVRAGHSLPPVRRTTGGWTATEVQQEMFSHFALISVELAGGGKRGPAAEQPKLNDPLLAIALAELAGSCLGHRTVHKV